jgi:hypothetical protein
MVENGVMRRGIAALVLAGLTGACGSGATAPTSTSTSTSPTTTATPNPATTSGTLQSLLTGLAGYVQQEIQNLQSLLPRNPQNATQIQAKITLLQKPTLSNEIIAGEWWVDSSVTTTTGKSLPAVTVFPLAQLRNEAQQELEIAKRTVPILEAFFDAAYPSPSIRMWYGFTIGNSSSNGLLYMEDRTTYESRTGPDRLPYDSIVSHEVSHSYIGNESVNQFLEIYAANLISTGNANLSSWTYARGWTPGLESNTGVFAILDIYQLVGLENMRHGYQALYAQHPPYGVALSAAAQQAFVDRMPVQFQPQVAAKLAKVTF